MSESIHLQPIFFPSTVNITQTDNPRDTCPTRGKRFCPTVENIIPPSDDPVVVAPRANPHFFENQWRITPNADPNMKPLASYRYQVINWFRRWNVGTHPTAEPLNEEKLPVLCTLCSEEYALQGFHQQGSSGHKFLQ